LAVLAAALWGASVRESIGVESVVTLLVTTTLAALLTRRGDLLLVVIYPPLAFMFSVLVAGQLLVDPAHSWRTGQGLVLVETLGRNARWVIAATITGAVLVGLRTLIRIVRARRSPAPGLAS
jgi:TRAP-type C4-dicarboxylate transport system permease small subunit